MFRFQFGKMNVSGQNRRQARMIVPASLLVISYLATTPTIQVDSLRWEDRLFLICVVRHGSAELLSHQLSNFVPEERRDSPSAAFSQKQLIFRTSTVAHFVD